MILLQKRVTGTAVVSLATRRALLYSASIGGDLVILTRGGDLLILTIGGDLLILTIGGDLLIPPIGGDLLILPIGGDLGSYGAIVIPH